MKKNTLLSFLYTLCCATTFAQNSFSFLHYSDAHGRPDSREHAMTLMENDKSIKFTIDTGDMIYDDDLSKFANKNFYTVLGNHDVIDSAKTVTEAVGKFIRSCVTDEDVTIHDKGYYYKDFCLTEEGTVLRMICMNSFEERRNTVTISIEQINWLAETLKSTPTNGYIVIALHAPVGTPEGFVDENCSFLESAKVENIKEQEYVSNVITKFFAQQLITEFFNNYVSDFFTQKGTAFDSALIPNIVNAYLCRNKYAKETVYTGDGGTYKLDLDFTGCKPAKFLCYLTGHVHVDLTGHLKEFPNQLLNDVATSNHEKIRQNFEKEFASQKLHYDINSEVTCSDTENFSTPNVAIDKITLDFENRVLAIERIGRDSDKNGKLVRARQEFPFENPADVKDCELYSNTKDNVNTIVNYERNFSTNAWQALYLPFSMKYEEWADRADIAELTGINERDGELRLCFEIIPEGGVTNPNTPYIIKPKTAGIMELTATNTTLTAKPEEDNWVSCSTTDNTVTCTLYGSYEAINDMFANGFYALAGGKFMQADSKEAKLSPNRIYLKIETPAGTETPKLVVAVSDAETTDIVSVSTDKKGTPARQRGCYNLVGQRLAAPVKGINIINGKKIVK